MLTPPLRSTILALVLVALVGTLGCGKGIATGVRITDSFTVVVEPGRGVPKVCEVGMSFAEIKRSAGEASLHKLKWRGPSRFVLVPSLGAIGIHERKGGVQLLTFYIQPYDSTITAPGLVVTNPFRGRIGTQLSFQNAPVGRSEIETAFGRIQQGFTNSGSNISYMSVDSIKKEEAFIVKRDKTENLYFPHLGLQFELNDGAVVSFSVSKPLKLK